MQVLKLYIINLSLLINFSVGIIYKNLKLVYFQYNGNLNSIRSIKTVDTIPLSTVFSFEQKVQVIGYNRECFITITKHFYDDTFR